MNVHPFKLTLAACIVLASALYGIAIYNGISEVGKLNHITYIGLALGIVAGPEFTTKEVFKNLQLQQAVGGMLSGYLISTYYYDSILYAQDMLVILSTIGGGILGAFHQPRPYANW